MKRLEPSMPKQEHYPLPTEYLFLPELDLALWDFLHYKAAQNDGWALFSLAEVFHDPRLIRNRQNLRPWLNAQESKGLIEIDKEALERKTQYLIKITYWRDNERPQILKPLTFHQNGWVHELASNEERWILNLFLLHENHEKRDLPPQPLSLSQLQAYIYEEMGNQLQALQQSHKNKKSKKKRKQALTKIGRLTDKNLNQLKNCLQSLVRLQLINQNHQGFCLNKSGFSQPAGIRYQERIRHDWPRQRKLIVAYLSQALSQEVSSQEEVVELIRYWHQIGGLRQRQFVNAYNQLTFAKDKDIDLKKLRAELKRRAKNPRDRTTSYDLVLKDFRRQSQKALPDFSNPLKLRLDHHTLVGAPFYFEPPLSARPISLTLCTIPRWPIRHLKPQKEQLTLLIWSEGREPIKVAELFSEHEGPLKTPLMGQLPARYNLATRLTLLIQSPRPLEGLTVNAKLEAR
jgi:hypothetical protein